MPACSDCGGTVMEYDSAAGNGFCVACGTVVEESAMVSELGFGETSGGAAMVQGSYVSLGATHARMGGPFGNRGNSESREQTIANATKKIQSVATILRLSEVVCMSATRLYTLAVEHKFTKGRKSMNVVAVCLYVACRQKETRTYMLIDFSDLLQVNVFELGHTYLQLVQTLNLRLPLVDPSHYVSRFAALLEFGDETHKVASDAVRLVQRFDRDWMTKGRRPAGICGAALLLAARMNNFRRSIEEIVQVVKIADTTLKKRLEEFKNTPSGALTLADFRTVWLDEQVDPPAYTKGLEKEEKARLKAEEGDEEEVKLTVKGKGKGKGKESAGKKGQKRKRGEEEEANDAEGEDIEQPAVVVALILDPSLLNTGILEGTGESLFASEDGDGKDGKDDSEILLDKLDPELSNIDPSLRPPSSGSAPLTPPPTSNAEAGPSNLLDDTVNAAVTDEVSTFLQNTQGTELTSALDDAEQRRLAQISVVDELLGLDEEELDRFLLTDEEVRIKERVWVELNKEYLEAIAAKGDAPDKSQGNKRRKTAKVEPRDASTPAGRTAAESVKALLQQPKYSKRINYDALKGLFVPGAPTGNIDLDAKEDDMYTMDDKDDAEMEIIEEDGGGVGQNTGAKGKGKAAARPEETFGDEGSEKGDNDVNWDDGYEQEAF